jgi:alpha-beta hydrolase superfamily lysophospholipase
MTVRTAEGTVLRTLRWQAPAGPRALALLVHGLGEHAGRYVTVARALTDAGLEVHGYDHRGFGGSGGPRGFVERWERFHDDLQERLLAVRAEGPDLPLVLYGHSMGGLIALGYALSSRQPPDLLVLSAPGLDSYLARSKRVLAALLTKVAPRVRVANDVPPGGLSRDPAVQALVEGDPLCLGTSTVRLGAEGFSEQRRVREAVSRLDTVPVPTYVLHGSADPIVPVAASVVLEGKGDVTRRVHDGLRHECHHEPEHEAVLAEVVAWLDARLPAIQPATVVSPPEAV